METLNGMTTLSAWGRQLSVLIVLSLGLTAPAFAQTSPAARGAVINGGTISQGPANEVPTMFVKGLSITETKRNDMTFVDFYLTSNLAVGFQYNYRFNFDFNIKSRRGYAPVKDGYYLLNVATFVHAPIRQTGVTQLISLEDRFVTINKPTVVRVIGGVAKPEVSLRFDNPTQGSVTNTLFVEFKPLSCPTGQQCLFFKDNGEVDETRSTLIGSNAVRSQLLSTPWVPALRTASADADPNEPLSNDSRRLTEIGLRQFALDQMALRQTSGTGMTQATTPPRAYAEAHHLALIDFNDPRLYRAGQRYMREDVRQTIHALLTNYKVKPVRLSDAKKTMQAAFCDVITQLNSPFPQNAPMDQARARILGLRIWDCQNRPEFLTIRRNLHVGRVNPLEFGTTGPKRPYKNGLLQNVTVGRSHDESAGSTATFKIWNFLTTPLRMTPAAIIARDIFGNFDYARTVSVTNSRNRNESGILTAQTFMDVTPVVVTSNAYRVQSCLEVKMTPAASQMLFNPDPNATNGFYVCENTVASASVEEVYMHAVTSMANTSVATAYDRDDQTVNLVLRGDGDISEFYRQIKGALQPVSPQDAIGGTAWPDWYTDQALRYFSTRSGQATNVISSPVVIGHDAEVPSFLTKLFGGYEEKI